MAGIADKPEVTREILPQLQSTRGERPKVMASLVVKVPSAGWDQLFRQTDVSALDFTPGGFDVPICPPPISCDLTGDRVACAILHAWARQPWNKFHRNVLCDRMEETGRSEQEMRWIRDDGPKGGASPGGRIVTHSYLMRQFPRRFTRHLYRRWRDELIRHFGDFESSLTDTTL